MDRCVLSICNNSSLNFILKTTLANKFQLVSTADVFHGMHELKKREEIELIIIDLDYHTQENLDFIQHTNSSGFYQMPIIVLSTDIDKEKKISQLEGHVMKFVQKPFDPRNLIDIINDCIPYSLAF